MTGTVEATTEKDKKEDKGISPLTIGAIITSLVAAGSAAGLWFLRKTPA